MRILTDVKEPRISVEWNRRTDFRPEILGGKGFLSNIIAALRLLRLRKNCDVIVLGGSRKGNLFAILSALWPGKRPPILMIDCLWYKPQNWFQLWLKRLQFHLMARAVNQFVVWASHEVRDYETLLKAVEGLGVKVVIATRLSNWNGNVKIPEQVKAFPTSHSDFRKWMAGSRMVVIPMEKGHLHSGGQQTYLNAMAMGKPVVVADDCGAKD